MGTDDLKVGDALRDRSIYAGTSPETGELLFIVEDEYGCPIIRAISKDGWRDATEPELAAARKSLVIANDELNARNCGRPPERGGPG